MRTGGSPDRRLHHARPASLAHHAQSSIAHPRSLLNILRVRYQMNRIYTNIGSILVSVNPFKPLPLYTPQQIDAYKMGPRGQAPHVFATGYNAYYELLNERKNQSVIITGESGAGKSEACKLVLQFIADLSATHSGRAISEDNQSLEQQLLQANPILEAFGNAKTVRNNNSSRFGKLITIKFDKLGGICESTVVSYLLEKSRVVHQSSGERNYHIFYEMVAAAEEDANLRKGLRLEGGCESFAYLNQSGVTRIEGVVDENDYDEMCNAMDVLNFSDTDQMEIWKVLAALLHFGNVKFSDTAKVDRDVDAKIANPDVLSFAAGLIGVKPAALTKVLLERILSVGKVVVPYKVKEAMDVRDAMVKTLYALMFEWIIRKINQTLEKNAGSDSSRAAKGSIIGLLDIFGFESFVTNSYEQLCINYCNEKLNNHFNEHVFKYELAIYAAEGVTVDELDFKDNQAILDFLENQSSGIYSLLDDQIMINGTDEKFLGRVSQLHKDSPQFMAPKRKNCPDPEPGNCFGVVHYAGVVFYNVRGFLEKNRDTLHPDVIDALKDSRSPMVSELFLEGNALGKGKIATSSSNHFSGLSSPTTSRKGKMATGNTLGKQFRVQLDALMVTLNATDPHYIRCMKPNSEKRGNMFVSTMMLQQLQYSGLLEVCHIRKCGFPIRRTFPEFFARYKVIHPGCPTLSALISKLESSKTIYNKGLAVGKTKVLMKQQQANDLDMAREKALEKHVVTIQAIARGFLIRTRLFFYKRILAELRLAIKRRDEEKLIHWLQQADELPNNGQHFPVVVEAMNILRRLEQETKVICLIEDALSNCNLAALLSAIADAHAMKPPLKHPRLQDAIRMKDLLEEERELKAKLREAITAHDIAAITLLLKRASEMGVNNDETRQATSLKLRIEEEAITRTRLLEATAVKDWDQLSSLLGKAAEMGLTGDDVDAAKEVHKALSVRKRAIADLAGATAARDLVQITECLEKCDEMGIKYAEEVEEATKVAHSIRQELECVVNLQAAMESMDLKMLENSIAAAKGMKLDGKRYPELGEAEKTRDAINRKIEEDTAKLAAELDRASKGSNSEALAAAIAKCTAAGMASKFANEIASAKERQRQLSNQGKARQALELALRTRSLDRIQEALVKAEACSYSGPEIEKARILKIELLRKKEVFEDIQRAMNAKDMGALGDALRQAEILDMEAELDEFVELQEMKNSMNREEKVKEVKEKLAAGVQSHDLQALNKAMAMAIELGCEGDADVQSAKALQTRLVGEEEAKSKIVAAQRSLGVKMQGKGGLTAADLAPLDAALADARAVGLTEDVNLMMKAVVLQDRCAQHLEAQNMLTQALASLNKTKMRDALEFAEELELDLEMMVRVRRALRRIEVMRDDDRPLDGGLTTMTDSDIEQFRAERDKRHLKASNPKYRFSNYPRLRTRSDYAKGTLLHKKREMERMLVWQSSLSNKSLLDVDKNLVKDAISIRKSLLGYMGDKSMSFPETLAQNILDKGMDKPKLRDEVYLQIMKQLTQNPKPDSTAKGWQMMCMCCGTFLPSVDFENYLLNFVLEKCNFDGAEACYAKYCLHTLEGMMSSRNNEGIVPTLEEIQAYKERPPILATIELVNGALLTEDLPVAPDLNVKKVLEICAHFGGLQSARTDIMGLFVYDLGPIDEEAAERSGLLPFTPTPLRREDFMGDQFIRKARQRRDFKFVYKRKIFLHSHPWPTNDAAFNRLVYLQSEDDVITTGTLEIDDQASVILLSSIAMAMDIAMDGDAPTHACELQSQVGKYIPPGWEGKVSASTWVEEMGKIWPDLISKDRHELEIMFVEQCRDRPMYGSHFFYATKVQCVPDLVSNLPKQLLLAFNADGMYIFGVNKKQLLQQYAYSDIHSWRGTRRQVSLTIWDEDTDSVFELALKTQQAQDAASIILDFISCIMANGGKN
jgi:myosin heavy subunit